MSTSNSSNDSSSENNLACGTLYESYVFKISWIVVYCMLLLVSLIGNALIVILVYKRKELRKTVNYLIANMAFSDFIFQLTSIPVYLADTASSPSQWPITGPVGLIFCKMQSFVMTASIAVSVQNLVWIALDRFIAVVFPMKVHLISSRFRVLVIAFTWIVAVLYGSAILDVTVINEKNGKLHCTEKKTSGSYTIIRHVGATFCFASLIFITTLYCTIAVTLRRKNKELPTAAVNGNDRRKRQATKMAVCVVAAFYCCFIPFIVVVFLLENVLEASCLLGKVLWPFAELAVKLSCTTNPIICFIFVKNYRRGLRELFSMFHFKCSNKQRNMENGQGVTLQSIRIIPEGA